MTDTPDIAEVEAIARKLTKAQRRLIPVALSLLADKREAA